MEISEEIIKKIECTIAETLSELITQKTRDRRLALKWGILGIVLGLIGGWMYVSSNPLNSSFWLLAGGPLAGFLLVWLIALSILGGRRGETYKAKVMPVIVDSLIPGAIYTPKGIITKKEVRESKVFQLGSAYNFYTEDGISGCIEQTKFIFSEIKIDKETSDGEHTYTETVFRGFALKADFNKHFDSKTFVYNRKMNISKGGTWFTKFKRCELEDVNFEKRYKCYTTDDQEARYLLTPSLQQSILELEDSLNAHVSIAFYDDQMLLLVDDGRDHFELKYNMDEIKKDLEAITKMVDIVELLNLNLRIWSKE